VCRRKRLTASEFSKKMCEKARTDPGSIKCKACVEKAANDERTAAATKAAGKQSIFQAGDAGAGGGGGGGTDAALELHQCSACKKDLAEGAFNRNQLRNKGPGKQRCIACIVEAEKSEASAAAGKQAAQLREVTQTARRAEACGTVGQKLKAASALAAAEAELVTGLRPMIIGRGGRGRGKGKGSWSARGRGKG
jgi:hypothetical protein